MTTAVGVISYLREESDCFESLWVSNLGHSLTTAEVQSPVDDYFYLSDHGLVTVVKFEYCAARVGLAG